MVERPRRVQHEHPDLPLVGSKLVVCGNCNRRGHANRKLLSPGQTKLESCRDCR